MNDTQPLDLDVYEADTDSEAEEHAVELAHLEVYLENCSPPERFALTLGKNVVGREKTANVQVCLPSSTVSKKHAIIQVTATRTCFLEDCGSTNKTSLDVNMDGRGSMFLESGKAYQLQHGNLLRFGDIMARFCLNGNHGPRSPASDGQSTQIYYADTSKGHPCATPEACPEKAVDTSVNSQRTIPYENLTDSLVIPETPIRDSCSEARDNEFYLESSFLDTPKETQADLHTVPESQFVATPVHCALPVGDVSMHSEGSQDMLQDLMDVESEPRGERSSWGMEEALKGLAQDEPDGTAGEGLIGGAASS
eukprot:CAMPEP_0174371938 /NCGR_PEP_ID=MMETSP0811_2-20130205/101617_1 /TAXON_ID=73025 ORGANISM="Eutreptiella gymnastica-like, Strain CCMP1594" /NCGR_SAMPLE_ID=MMETSP0811_2 /ASSEMBLY_ACC=CAM_ASM_000667 /LENGTH=308 /DNA_ID=CAMNT_0015518817 /DNA_START=27 /DNA_END=950 /DNA_ORIENTATION=-